MPASLSTPVTVGCCTPATRSSTRGTLDGESRVPRIVTTWEALIAFDRKRVHDNHARLTELYRRGDADLLIVCAHDPTLSSRSSHRITVTGRSPMRAVVITKHGDPSVLKMQERPDPPPPAAGQVRIAVAAAGVNFADHLARVGLYPDAPKLPCVVGYEVAGTVEAVGDGVDPAGGRTRLGRNTFRRICRDRQRQGRRHRGAAGLA